MRLHQAPGLWVNTFKYVISLVSYQNTYVTFGQWSNGPNTTHSTRYYGYYTLQTSLKIPTTMMIFAVTTGGTTDDTVAATPIVVSCEASAAAKPDVFAPPLALSDLSAPLLALPFTPALAVV